MKQLRIIKYPGSKGAIITHISKLFRESGCSKFIDVFGGSGVVSLNVDARKIVYNDVNSELVNIFRSIKEDRHDIIHRKLVDLLSVNEIYMKEGANRMNARSYTGKDYNRLIREKIDRITDNLEKRDNIRETGPDSAFISICRFSTSFGGFGRGYATENEKSPYRYLIKTLHSYEEIKRKVNKWEIECIDFRKLIRKYDSADAFFFLDPPYLSRKWYSDDFGHKDFSDLVKMLNVISGKFLLVLEPVSNGYGNCDLLRFPTMKVTTSMSRGSVASRHMDLYYNFTHASRNDA